MTVREAKRVGGTDELRMMEELKNHIASRYSKATFRHLYSQKETSIIMD